MPQLQLHLLFSQPHCGSVCPIVTRTANPAVLPTCYQSNRSHHGFRPIPIAALGVAFLNLSLPVVSPIERVICLGIFRHGLFCRGCEDWLRLLLISRAYSFISIRKRRSTRAAVRARILPFPTCNVDVSKPSRRASSAFVKPSSSNTLIWCQV